MGTGGFVAAALKWADLRPEMDPLTGTLTGDRRTWGMSPADGAALEWALRLGAAWGLPVTAVTAGRGEADAVLREAAAAGATRLVRVDLDPGQPSDVVAHGLAQALAGATVVCCGDHSVDRGSGSVPAYLAHSLGAAQALGLTTLAASESPGGLTAERRLDGGRRERLHVTQPAVVSVEPAGVRLRRASLSGLAAARNLAVHVVPPGTQPRHATVVQSLHTAPYRPRARVLPPPPADRGPRERLLALTRALVERTPPREVTAGADEAADELLAYLKTNGYLG
jgi:electron transfer flavoprotein beta subunit